MLTPENAVMAAFLACCAGAVLTLLTGRHKILSGWLAFLVTVIASGLVLYAAGRVLWFGPAHAVTYWTLPKYGFALRIYVDGLSAIFLGLISVTALASTFYSIEYMGHDPCRTVRRYYPNLLLFIGAMHGIVCTTDTLFFFFIFWQLMTLTAFGLIRFDHTQPANLRAANKYLVMMQIACALTLIGALCLATTSAVVGQETLPRYDFDTFSHYLPQLFQEKSRWVNFAFLMFLLGFGIKVGLWPFGPVWLPDAHPAAPSPVSALLSGVMIKTGIYGFMRYFIWLVPASSVTSYPNEEWGLAIAVLGTITLLLGTMEALRQDQTKRLLAYSSIGQMGYILLAIGACLSVIHSQPALAALAFFGALFHTVNHGLFKTLLFLNAGSVAQATGTQDLNQLGGLFKYMRVTGCTTLAGCLAIAGVPLFCGFASKWNIYVSVIQCGSAASFLPICAVIAMANGGLTLAVFVKFFGAAFLTRTSALVRQRAARQTLEVSWKMWLPKTALAALCILLGLVPLAAWHWTQLALASSPQGLGPLLLTRTPIKDIGISGFYSLGGRAVYAPAILLLILGLSLVLAFGISRLGGAAKRRVAPWLCGYAREHAAHQYGARNYYGVLRGYFQRLSRRPATPKRPPDSPSQAPPNA